MRDMLRSAAIGASVLVSLAFLGGVAEGQQIGLQQRPWTGEVIRASGQPVIPLFDGWFGNEDGTRTLCFGYLNLNTEEAVEVSVGPDNRLSPATFDGAQPTHFDPLPEYRRKWCAYTVDVPATFTERDRVVWTLRSGGEELSVPGHVLPAFVLDEIRSDGRGDVAPTLAVDGARDPAQGRRGLRTWPLRAMVGQPLTMNVQVTHPEGRAWVGWSKHQGPGDVDFSEAEFTLRDPEMSRATDAVFSEPGEYVLRVQSIDSLAAFEFHCCWTNVFVPVVVR